MDIFSSWSTNSTAASFVEVVMVELAILDISPVHSTYRTGPKILP